MAYDVTLQKHIRCKQGDVAEYVFIPGDPARAERIAKTFDTYAKVAENREYVVYTGMKDGQRLSVCSTGIGGPSTAIAIEELAKIGAHTFIRVGSAGGRQEKIAVGSVVVVNAAIKGDGTSIAYLPAIYPAVADFAVTQALMESAQALLGDEPFYVGTSFTRDAYYVQNQELNEKFKNTDAAVSEMECATVFTVGSLRRLRTGAIVGTDSNILLKTQLSLEEKDCLYAEAERKTIQIAVQAALKLAEADQNG
ncbi:MAG TPA: nucleoside phosphorylase [Bacillota bacterium]|nr:nucleoside phosphorylase [Bacillota bacterium]